MRLYLGVVQTARSALHCTHQAVHADTKTGLCYCGFMAENDENASGGCLCGAVRFCVSAEPYYVAVCACTFCQRITGSDYNVESMFRVAQFKLTEGQTQTYTHLSQGSGHPVHVHFCARCGTSLFLRPDRFPDCVGVFSGVFDDPNWFQRDTETVGYFFTSEAPRGMVIPADFDTYPSHAKALDGSENTPARHAHSFMVGAKRQQ